MSQNNTVLKHMQSGRPINPQIAYEDYKIMRLASLISDLKREGHTILDKTIKNGKKRYSEYWMEVDPTMNLFKSNYGGLQ